MAAISFRIIIKAMTKSGQEKVPSEICVIAVSNVAIIKIYIDNTAGHKSYESKTKLKFLHELGTRGSFQFYGADAPYA